MMNGSLMCRSGWEGSRPSSGWVGRARRERVSRVLIATLKDSFTQPRRSSSSIVRSKNSFRLCYVQVQLDQVPPDHVSLHGLSLLWIHD